MTLTQWGLKKSMSTVEIFLLLLVVIAAIALAANRLKIPYPIAFVIAGAGVALVPDLPDVRLDPELIFLIFLPPLLQEAAFYTSLRDFMKNLRPILLLALGLVLVTSAAIAWSMVWLIPGFTLALGFLLGGVVAPPDAVAANAITKRLQVPKRVITILEGESLVNDATSLIIFKFALAAVLTGHFTLMQAGMQFLWGASSGILIGLGLGYVIVRIFRHIREQSVEIIITFLSAYTAYLLAEHFHGSGVLAVVTQGLVIGWYAPMIFNAEFRLKSKAVWEMVIFLLNGFAFLLVGLQFPSVLHRLSDYEPQTLLLYGAIMSGVLISVRFIWVFIAAYGAHWFFPWCARKDPAPRWQNVFVIAWAGMRGVISLAAALSIPYALEDWTPFPHRDMIVYLASVAIFVTLVLQGLTLPFLIRKLNLTFDDEALQEEWHARREVTLSVLSRLKELAEKEGCSNAAFQRIKSHYQDRLDALGDGPNTPLYTPIGEVISPLPAKLAAEHRLWRDVIVVEHQVLFGLRQAARLGDDILRKLQHESDLLSERFKYS